MVYGLSDDEIREVVKRVIEARNKEKSREELPEYTVRNIKLRGKPFSFDGHEYLRDIYADAVPRTVFMKAAQVGISTYHLIKALWLAQGGYKSVYFLPTSSMAAAFGKERFKPLLEQSFPDGFAGPSQAVRIADGAVLFRGLLSEEGVRSIDADYVVLDEFDAAVPERAELAADRLLHSELGWLSYLSTPTMSGVGVDKLYAKSDQKHWLVKCSQCRWEGDLTRHFPDCIAERGGDVYRICPKCYNPINVLVGRWVAAYPSQNEIAGYHISHLGTSLPAKKIWQAFEEADKSYQVRRFYNSILGLPYAEASVGLSAWDIETAFSEPPERFTRAHLGIDVGDVIHSALLVQTDTGLFAVELATHTSFDELDRLMERHSVSNCVIDAMPYKASSAGFARRWLGQVYLAYLGAGRYAPGTERHAEGEVLKLGLDRTVALDELTEDIRSGALRLPRSEAGEKAGEHLLNLYRVIDENDSGKSKALWRNRGPDHFAFALLFAREAARLSTSDEKPVLGGERYFGGGGLPE